MTITPFYQQMMQPRLMDHERAQMFKDLQDKRLREALADDGQRPGSGGGQPMMPMMPMPNPVAVVPKSMGGRAALPATTGRRPGDRATAIGGTTLMPNANLGGLSYGGGVGTDQGPIVRGEGAMGVPMHIGLANKPPAMPTNSGVGMGIAPGTGPLQPPAVAPGMGPLDPSNPMNRFNMRPQIIPGVPAFAAGGIPPKNQPFTVGEAGPELMQIDNNGNAAVMPLQVNPGLPQQNLAPAPAIPRSTMRRFIRSPRGAAFMLGQQANEAQMNLQNQFINQRMSQERTWQTQDREAAKKEKDAETQAELDRSTMMLDALSSNAAILTPAQRQTLLGIKDAKGRMSALDVYMRQNQIEREQAAKNAPDVMSQQPVPGTGYVNQFRNGQFAGTLPLQQQQPELTPEQIKQLEDAGYNVTRKVGNATISKAPATSQRQAAPITTTRRTPGAKPGDPETVETLQWQPDAQNPNGGQWIPLPVRGADAAGNKAPSPFLQNYSRLRGTAQ